MHGRGQQVERAGKLQSGSAQESLKVERAVEVMRLATYAESDRVKRILRILVQRVNNIG